MSVLKSERKREGLLDKRLVVSVEINSVFIAIDGIKTSGIWYSNSRNAHSIDVVIITTTTKTHNYNSNRSSRSSTRILRVLSG